MIEGIYEELGLITPKTVLSSCFHQTKMSSGTDFGNGWIGLNQLSRLCIGILCLCPFIYYNNSYFIWMNSASYSLAIKE